MPTWCENILHVRGKRADVDTMLESVCSDQQDSDGKPMLFDFNRIIPCPKELQASLSRLSKLDDPITRHTEQASSAASAYWWCIKYWGTKWNASNSNVIRRRYGADLTFDTAWAAPLPVIFKLLEQHPLLAFSLHYRLEDKTRYHLYRPQ